MFLNRLLGTFLVVLPAKDLEGCLSGAGASTTALLRGARVLLGVSCVIDEALIAARELLADDSTFT